MTRVDYDNDAYSTFTYDDLNRVNTIIHYASDNGVFKYFDYTYDNNSNVTRVDIMIEGNDLYKTYEYDELNRLTEEEYYIYGGPTLQYSYDYTYDAVGNRTSMVNFNGSQTVTTNYIYNSLNQLMQRSKGGNYSYTYDDNGNMINENLGVDLRHFEYNLDDRMVQALIDEEDEYDFEYELGGKLLLKTYADGSQRKYYYDGIKVILEKTKPAQGSWTTSKVYTIGGGVSGGDIGFIIAEREISGQNNTDRWYHYDRLGNVMALSNSSGSPSTYFDQDAFGNVLSGSANGYHLTTKDNHTDIGLYYFNQRWLEPMLGRFIQKDPVKSINKYSYVDNNPINFIDPLGLAKRARVCCRDVRAAIFWVFQHCYIEIIDDQHGRHTFGLHDVGGEGVVRANDPSDHGGTCGPWACGGNADCIASEIGKQGSNPGSYDPINNNCNTFVSNVLKACVGDSWTGYFPGGWSGNIPGRGI